MKRLWLAFVLVGCGGFTIDVDGATDETLVYQALLFEGQCLDADQLGERTVVTRVNLPRGGTDDGVGVGRLDQTMYAIAVVGRDATCNVRAFGCAEFEPGPGDRVTVSVTSTAPGPTCPATEVCISQACEALGDGGLFDAGVDAATDTAIDSPTDAPDGGQLDPCVLEAAATACTRDEDCAPPFLTCDEVCVPSASLACEATSVMLPRPAEVIDVAIAQYLVMDETAEVEVWAVSEGELFAGRVISELSGDTLRLREFTLASGGNIDAAYSWGDRHLVRTTGGAPAIYDYNPTPYGEPDVPSLAWAGVLPYCGSSYTDVPNAVMYASRDPIVAPSVAFLVDDFVWDDSDGDPMCRGDFDLGQLLSAVEGSFAAFADTTADPIAEIVPSTGPLLALHQRDRGVSVWDAQPMMAPVLTPTVDLGFESDVAPGWAAQATVYRLVTSVGGNLQLRSVRSCSTACDVSSPVTIATGAAANRLQLVELDGDGRVLLVLRDGALDAMLLSDGNLGADDPGALLATVRLSADERITDFDAFFDRDTDTFFVLGLDEDGAPRLYRLQVP